MPGQPSQASTSTPTTPGFTTTWGCHARRLRTCWEGRHGKATATAQALLATTAPESDDTARQYPIRVK